MAQQQITDTDSQARSHRRSAVVLGCLGMLGSALLLSACSSGGGGGGGDGPDVDPVLPGDPEVITLNYTAIGLHGSTQVDAAATLQAGSQTLSDDDAETQSFSFQADVPGDLPRPNLSGTTYTLELDLAPASNPGATTTQTVLVQIGPREIR